MSEPRFLGASIPKSMIQAAAKDPSRYAISGVHVRVGPYGRGFASVTDGRVLAVRGIVGERPDDRRHATQGMVVPREALSGKILNKRQPNRHNVTMMTDKVINSSTNGFTPRPTEEVTFPPSEKVCPEWTDDHHVVALNTELLANVAKALGSKGVTLAFPKDPGKPIIVMANDRSEDPDDVEGLARFGVLMPIKVLDANPRKDYSEAVAEYTRACEQDDWVNPTPPDEEEIEATPVVATVAGGAVVETTQEEPAVTPTATAPAPSVEDLPPHIRALMAKHTPGATTAPPAQAALAG